MKIKTTLGILSGKSAVFILKSLKRGSTFPGKIALTFDKNILQTLAKDYEIIVVTGTNGKTLTTALTVKILREVFSQVVTNTSGANMITGIASTFLANTQTTDNRKIAVLEIDEASLSNICDYIKPTLFLLTNIFRDQMDRYGEIYTTYQMILKGINKVPTATILANGDSPIFNSIKLKNPVQFYGFDTKYHAPKPAHYNTEGILCPKCQNILSFKLNTYANLGNYLCENCNFKRPKLDYQLTKLTSITHENAQFIIDHHNYEIRIGGLYNIYNALAAVSVTKYLGLKPTTIKKGLDASEAVFGRQETFKIGNKNCTIILIKNPVGATQALEMIGLAPFSFTLSILLNANYADGIDTSWIWDAEFEKILDMNIPEIFVSGDRYSEIGRRIRVSGYPPNHIQKSKELLSVFNFIKEQNEKYSYILATYTAMLEFRKILAARNIVQKENK